MYSAAGVGTRRTLGVPGSRERELESPVDAEVLLPLQLPLLLNRIEVCPGITTVPLMWLLFVSAPTV